jgi:hypothetical protein
VGGGLITLRLSGSRTGALATALVFVLRGGIAGKLEWSDVVVVYGWMPWVFLPLLWERRGPTLRFILLAAVAWGIQALGGHPPYWVLTGIGAAAIILVRLPSLTSVRPLKVRVGITLTRSSARIPPALITVLSERALASTGDLRVQRHAVRLPRGRIRERVRPPVARRGLPQGWYPAGSGRSSSPTPYVGLPALAFAIVGLRVRRLRPLLALAAIAIVLPMAGALQVPILAPVFTVPASHPGYLLLDRHSPSERVSASHVWAGCRWIGAHRRSSLASRSRATSSSPRLAVAPSSLVDGFWRFLVPDIADAQHLAAQTLTSAWPLVMELVLGVIALLAVRSRRRSVSVRLGAVALVVLMVLLVHTINATGPLSAFTLDGTPRPGAAPNRVERDPDDRRAILPPSTDSSNATMAATRTFSRRSLRSPSPSRVRRAARGSVVTARSCCQSDGVDTVVAYEGAAMPGDHLGTSSVDGGTTICRLDGAIRAPYWMPAGAVPSLPEAANSILAPSDVTVDLSAAVADAKPGDALARDAAGLSMNVTAPGAGFVWIDRSWWPVGRSRWTASPSIRIAPGEASSSRSRPDSFHRTAVRAPRCALGRAADRAA